MLWEVAWSIAGFSMEIGKERIEPKRRRRCGEVRVFITCFWELRTAEGRVLSEENNPEVDEWTPVLQQHLEGQFVESIAIDLGSHKLLMKVLNGTELTVVPRPDEAGWTIFYFDQDSARHWCTMKGKEIGYDD
jgi:hypothetical protein